MLALNALVLNSCSVNSSQGKNDIITQKNTISTLTGNDTHRNLAQNHNLLTGKKGENRVLRASIITSVSHVMGCLMLFSEHDHKETLYN